MGGFSRGIRCLRCCPCSKTKCALSYHHQVLTFILSHICASEHTRFRVNRIKQLWLYMTERYIAHGPIPNGPGWVLILE